MLPTEDMEYGSMLLTVVSLWRPFHLAGRQVQKKLVQQVTNTRHTNYGFGLEFFGPVLPEKSLLKKPMVFPSQNPFGNATGRYHGTLYIQIFLDFDWL